jgi:acetylornithine deacetylase/succinyl-diaminopimelate desuccinylase-like protein
VTDVTFFNREKAMNWTTWTPIFTGGVIPNTAAMNISFSVGKTESDEITQKLLPKYNGTCEVVPELPAGLDPRGIPDSMPIALRHKKPTFLPTMAKVAVLARHGDYPRGRRAVADCTAFQTGVGQLKPGTSIDDAMNTLEAPVKQCFEGLMKELVSLDTHSQGAAAGAGIMQKTTQKEVQDLLTEVVELFGGTMTGYFDESKGMQTPLLCGKFPSSGTKTASVLVYNHLDVMAPSEWQKEQPAFSLNKTSTKGDEFVGRGTTDDKGPLVSALLGNVLARRLQPGLEVYVLYEMQEETGSQSFKVGLDLVDEAEQGALASVDKVLVSDTLWAADMRPALIYSLRGMFGFELTVKGADAKDWRALVALADALGLLSDPVTGKLGQKLTDAGYHGVPVDDATVAEFEKGGPDWPDSTCAFRSGDKGERLQATWTRPTVEPHMIGTNEQGDLILQLSSRIVYNMTSKQAQKLLEDVVNAMPSSRPLPASVPPPPPRSSSPSVSVSVSVGVNASPVIFTAKPGAEPFFTELSNASKSLATNAYHDAFPSTDPLTFNGIGGTVGFLPIIQEYFRAKGKDPPLLLAGLSLPTDGYHEPKEHFYWTQGEGGVKLFAHFLLADPPQPAAAGGLSALAQGA